MNQVRSKVGQELLNTLRKKEVNGKVEINTADLAGELFGGAASFESHYRNEIARGIREMEEKGILITHRENGQIKYVSLNQKSLPTFNEDNNPIIQGGIETTKTEAPKKNVDRMVNSIANANMARELFKEIKADNPDLSINSLVDKTTEKMNETVESGNFRYLRGRNMPLTRSTIYNYLSGRVGSSGSEPIGPSLISSPRLTHIVKEPVQLDTFRMEKAIIDAFSEITEKQTKDFKESLSSVKIPANLTTKEQHDRTERAIAQLNTSVSTLNDTMGKLVAALWASGNSGMKSTIQRLLPDILAKQRDKDNL